MKKLKVVMLLSTITILSILLFTGCGRKTYNLSDYLTYELSGYDGYGSVTTHFNTNALELDIQNDLGLGNKSLLEYSANDEAKFMIISELVHSISGSWDKESELRNGDSITYTWRISDVMTKNSLGVSFKYNSIKDTVTGLDPLKDFDPFEQIRVDFDGFSGEGTVSVHSADYDDYMSVEPRSGLSNGDVVTVTFGKDMDETDMLNAFGGKPIRVQTTFEVGGLDEYITKIDDIPKSVLDDMKDQLADFVETAYATRDDYEYVDYEVLGCYLLSPKSMSGYVSEHNQLYLVYKADVKHIDNDGETEVVTAYKYLKFHDIVRYSDGTGYVDLLDYDHPSSGLFVLVDESFTSESGQIYTGYKDIKTLYNQCIASQKAEWVVDTDSQLLGYE